MTEPLYRGEAICKRWGDSSSAGRTVTLQLEDGGEHPFRGYEGERFAIVVVPIGNDEKPMKKLLGDASTREDEVKALRPVDGGDAHKATSSPAKPKKRWHEMPPSQRAGMLCDDPEFWAFLNASNTHAIASGDVAPVETKDGAAAVLRLVCGVTSRSEIKAGHALKQFESVEGHFQAWRQARQHGAA